MLSIRYLVLVTQIGIGLFLILTASVFIANYWGAPWVTTPTSKINHMLKLASLQPGENLIDLGSGDGRILIHAAENYQARALGVEIDPIRVGLSKLFIALRGLGSRVEVVWGNIFHQDLSQADVITIFLTRPTNQKLKNHFEKQLKMGTRIASSAFPILEWTPKIIDDTHLIFIYEIGKTGEENQTQFV